MGNIVHMGVVWKRGVEEIWFGVWWYVKFLKQDWTVRNYQEKFEALLNRVELSEKHAASLFLGGLKSEISLQIRMFTVATLSDAYYLAKMQEQTLLVLKSRYGPVLSKSLQMLVVQAICIEMLLLPLNQTLC